eukprot:g19333.t1
MSTAHSASESQFGKVWVGPTGMFAWLASIFGSMRMDDIKSCQTVLKNHHEWLLKEQADAPKGERAIYDEKIEEAEQKMDPSSSSCAWRHCSHRTPLSELSEPIIKKETNVWQPMAGVGFRGGARRPKWSKRSCERIPQEAVLRG